MYYLISGVIFIDKCFDLLFHVHELVRWAHPTVSDLVFYTLTLMG